MDAHQSDPDCPDCGHKVRLHSHRLGCINCTCQPNSPTESEHTMSALTIAYVSRIPECDIHKYNLGVSGVPAKYDACTTRGSQWASMCEPCWVANRRYPDLGTGKGQEYVLGEPPARDRKAEAQAAAKANDIDGFFEAVGDGDPLDFL